MWIPFTVGVIGLCAFVVRQLNVPQDQRPVQREQEGHPHKPMLLAPVRGGEVVIDEIFVPLEVVETAGEVEELAVKSDAHLIRRQFQLLNLALRQAEKENRSIIDSVTDIIFETATDGKILFLTDSAPHQ